MPEVALIVGNISLLLLVAAAVLAFSKRTGFPFTVALVITGIGLKEIAQLEGGPLPSLAGFVASPEVILFVFLPTLIFESAFTLDGRQMRHNIGAILTLAVPGLILSTALIGLIIWLVTPLDIFTALLLGSILSATDPVAVIALMRQLGAPKRLAILIEGESLFNDATAIVVSRILVGMAAVGYAGSQGLGQGILEFFLVFFGGIAVGWVAALLTGWAIGRVEADPFIEISLTTILAYLSFLVAEEIFHVSGVMATVAAGLTIGGWGRTKISPSISLYLHNFWEYMGSFANALIFLLVGLSVELRAVAASLDILIWAIFAMLFSRAVVIYTLVPLCHYLGKGEAISRAYQSVMVWGGLRGAIALAIALSLEDVAHSDTIIAVVMGAVLFTLLLPGLTIESLMRYLGLNKPPLADRLSRIEELIDAKTQARDRLGELQKGGLFSARITAHVHQKTGQEIEGLRHQLDTLRNEELTPQRENDLLFIRMLAIERHYYFELFSKGHLSERAFREICHSIDLQIESLRRGVPLPEHTLRPPALLALRHKIDRILSVTLGFTGFPERLRSQRTARDYEESWGQYQACVYVLDELDRLEKADMASLEMINKLRSRYDTWKTSARRRIDATAEQFPEFVSAMQENLAERLFINAEEERVRQASHEGTLDEEVAGTILAEMDQQILRLRGIETKHLHIAPQELLRRVPFFCSAPEEEFLQVVDHLVPMTVPAGESIIEQGEVGGSLFLILRGVVRVVQSDKGEETEIATLMSGDFFGEMALLHRARRSASCRAVTPCSLYQLKRKDFEKICDQCPCLKQALEKADRKRRPGLENARS